MSHHHLVKRALEIDLEEIKHLAAACRTAPIAVRHVLLGIIGDETREACIWNTILAYYHEDMMPAYPDTGDMYGPRPPYGDYDPYKEKGDYGKAKQE